MFRPQIQKTRTLFVIAFINICVVVTVSNSLTYKEYDNVNLRYDSTQLMSSCIESIKDITDLKIIEDLTLEAVEVDESIKLEDTMTILETYVNELEDHIDKKNIVKIVKSLYLEALNV